MQLNRIACPSVGHKAFEKSLSSIALGDTDSPSQLTKFVRPYSQTRCDIGMIFAPGELQKKDMAAAATMFEYPQFLAATFRSHQARFLTSECRIFQFQSVPASGTPFVFGMFITDGDNNLIDFCVDSPHSTKRRAVLLRLIRAICTTSSVSRRFEH